MTTLKFLEEKRFESAACFLDYLRPTRDHWGSGPTPSFIFRGQNSASWALLPSAWRPGFRQTSIGKALSQGWPQKVANNWCTQYFNGEGPTANTLMNLVRVLDNVAARRERFIAAIVQCCSELDLVSRFHALADELGFDVPDASAEANCLLKLKEDQPMPASVRPWSSQAPTDIHCFAQHHHVPTRLLDWSYSPLVGAYFAVAGWGQAHGDPVVWALNKQVAIDPCVDQALWKPEDQELRLLAHGCPRSRHSFLHAQSGIFTYVAGADRHFLSCGGYPTVEDALAHSNLRDTPGVLMKLVLASSQVKELRKLLARERMSKARMMPALDHLIETIELEVLWDDA